MKHTPTPWEYYHNIEAKYVRIHSGDEATRTDIADLVTWNDLEEEIEEAAANAALIVTAVNNHEKLVYQLQEIIENFKKAKSINNLDLSNSIDHAEYILTTLNP